MKLEKGGKTYHPPLLDSQGILYLFFGYGDQELQIERIYIKDFLPATTTMALP